MTSEEKFNAAVNVIRNLPKNGAYQPSNDLLLKFYSYYKQATEGPCKQPKPGIWDPVKRAKWFAWTKLGNMGREEAMNNYVEELKQIIETMSYTENVATFFNSLDSFYETIPAEDLELVAGPVLERVRLQKDLASRDLSNALPETFPDQIKQGASDYNSFDTNSECIDNVSEYHSENTNDEQAIEPVELTQSIHQKPYMKSYNQQVENEQYFNGESALSDLKSNTLIMNDCTNKATNINSVEVNMNIIRQILNTLKIVQNDLDQVMIRLTNLEEQILFTRKLPKNFSFRFRDVTRRLLPQVSSELLTFLILWPFVAQLVISFVKRWRISSR